MCQGIYDGQELEMFRLSQILTSFTHHFHVRLFKDRIQWLIGGWWLNEPRVRPKTSVGFEGSDGPWVSDGVLQNGFRGSPQTRGRGREWGKPMVSFPSIRLVD